MRAAVGATALLLVACSATPAPSTQTLPPTTDATTTTTPSTTTSTSAPPTSTSTIPTTTTTLAPLQGLSAELVAEGLAQPTVVAAPPGDDRLIVVERTGVLRVVDPAAGLEAEPYLDLSGHVTSGGIEQGMLGLAFHPEFAENGRLFVYYVNAEGQRTLAEVTAVDGRPDPATERVLFSLDQPPGSVDIRHYAGMVAFGPDGNLYVSLGDGADARNQGQNPDTVFGAVLRLDVDGEEPYGIPPDNPFASGGGAPEVWAYGMRNPWRFTIDPTDGLVYIADVGQETWEEVNVLPLGAGGANLGWPDMEGNHCFLDSDCDPAAFTTPVLEYGHEEGCSITGGVVYRGSAIPEVGGHYFYADWCSGWVRSFRYSGGEATEPSDWSADLDGIGQPNAFGVDATGEMYVATYGGAVFRIVPVR